MLNACMNNNNLNVALGVVISNSNHGSGSGALCGNSPPDYRNFTGPAGSAEFNPSGSVTAGSTGGTTMDPLVDDFEPQPRDRCNTWPLQRPAGDLGHHTSPLIHEGIPEEEDDDDRAEGVDNGIDEVEFGGHGSEDNFSRDGSSTGPYINRSSSNTNNGSGTDSCFGGFYGNVAASASMSIAGSDSMRTDVSGLYCEATEEGRQHQQQQQAKKNTSRRNAWGNLSYADLITQAIRSSSDQRLTLAQIYDWFGQNVPYFRDKGDSNSSAGWKNSIRHNLSLHSRFVRLQNEGAGKSSWWILNPDAKPGKSSRRRSATIEQPQALKMLEKKRGRSKKKLDVSHASTGALVDACAGSVSGATGTTMAAGPSSRGSPQSLDFDPATVNIAGFASMGGQPSSNTLSRPRCDSSADGTSAGPTTEASGNGGTHSTTMIGGTAVASHLTHLDFRQRSDSNLSNYSVASCGTGSKLNGPVHGGRLTPSLEESLFDEWDMSSQHALQTTPGSVLGSAFDASDSNTELSAYPDLVDSLSQSMSLGGAGRPGAANSPERRTMHAHQVHMVDVLSLPPYRSAARRTEGAERPSPESNQCHQQPMLAANHSPRNRTAASSVTAKSSKQHQQPVGPSAQPVINNMSVATALSGFGSVKADPNTSNFGSFGTVKPEPPTYQELYPANTGGCLRTSSSNPMLREVLQQQKVVLSPHQTGPPNRTLSVKASGSECSSFIASPSRGSPCFIPIASAQDHLAVTSLLLNPGNHQPNNGLHHYATNNHNQHQYGQLYHLNHHHQQQLPMELSEIHYDHTFKSDIQCDIDQVFRHELRVAGNLDFTNI